MKILIKNGHVIDPANKIDEELDILIDGKKIIEVKKNITETSDKEIDAKGKYVVPGLIDMHVHLREPGYEYKEDIVSGTKAAVMGGVTSVLCMPNTNPVCDNKAVVSYIISKAQKEGYANVFPVGTISKGMQGKELSEMGDLKDAGAVAVSDDGRPISDASLMKKALQYAKMFNLPVISHCEDLALAEDGDMNEGFMSTYLGLRGITRAAEEVQAARDIIIAESTNTAVHIAHISTKGTVELVRQAKKRGVLVTCETAPHYFTLTEKAVEGYNTNAKMNPPLRCEDDIDAIIEGLKDGTIDAIITDHAPHHIDEKDCEFALANNGIVGLETSLGLGLKYLVKENKLTISELIALMSQKPAELLGLDKGTLGVGKDADVTIFDINKDWIVDVNEFKSKSNNSPYNGFTLCGKPEYVIVGGDIRVFEGKLEER